MPSRSRSPPTTRRGSRCGSPATAAKPCRPRASLNTLPARIQTTASALSRCPRSSPAPAASTAGVGPPDVAADEKGGRKASCASAYARRLPGAAGGGRPRAARWPRLATPPGPPALAGAEAGRRRRPRRRRRSSPIRRSTRPGGSPVAVRQEFSSGRGADRPSLRAPAGRPDRRAAIGRLGRGRRADRLPPGRSRGASEIVAERISAPPGPFKVKVPKGWSRPGAVKLRWEAAGERGRRGHLLGPDRRPAGRDAACAGGLPSRARTCSATARCEVQVLATDGLRPAAAEQTGEAARRRRSRR